MKMTRRQFLKLGAAASGSTLIPSFSCTKRFTSPNILLIYVDDLGYGDLSCYGGDIPTPNIDSLAQQGIRFTSFYSSAPACTPSRYSLLTGCYPHRSLHGLDKVYMPGDEMHLDPRETTLAELLKSEGYSTAVFGKWHLGKKSKDYFPIHNGFEQFCGFAGGCVDYYRHSYGPLEKDWYINNEFLEEGGYATELITNHTLTYLKKQSALKNPFFAYLSYSAPHYGKTDVEDVPENTLNLKQTEYQGHQVMNTLQAPKEYLDKFAHIESPQRQYYMAMVASLDDQVGRVLKLLDESGNRDNTMIWFISDNGGYSESYFQHADNGDLRGEKATVYEGGIRIPAMVSWKNRIKSGQINEQVIINMDIVPTLAKILGFSDKLKKIPVDGWDISATLFQNEAVPSRPLYWTWANKNATRFGKWKLVHNEELYDLENDLSETTNLATQHPDIVQKLLVEQKKIQSLPKYQKKDSKQ
jgi:arylsulfatase A-like enzyme